MLHDLARLFPFNVPPGCGESAFGCGRACAVLALGAALAAACSPATRQEPAERAAPAEGAAPAERAAPALDTAALEDVEEITESFANDLLALSVAARDGDLAAVGEHLAESMASLRIPARPGPLAPEWKWVQQRDFEAATPAPGPATRAAALAGLGTLLDHFGEIEDVRFKVTSLAPRREGGGALAAEGTFKCYFVGRNLDGMREWAKGTGTIAGRRASDGTAWVLHVLAFDGLHSLVASVDAFEDVGEAAGVEEWDPSFAERGNEALLAHGAAAADVDLDGRLDVFVNGLTRSWLYLGQPDGTFREAAREARVATLASPGVGAVFLDVENDGDSDLFVTTLDRQALFENRLVPDGALAFRDVSTRAGVDVPAKAFSAAAGDVDGDGLPDIAVACYGDYGKVVPDSWDAATNGERNLLFLNRGGGRFLEAAAERGVADARWSYAAMLVDVDGDADLDLLVANDFGPGAALFVNDGTGRFTDESAARGVSRPGYAMGLSVSDWDADGDLDLHVTQMSSTAGARILGRTAPGSVPDAARLETLFSGNTLLENLGGGRFADVSRKLGPFKGGWAWGGGFLDIDNDGLEDLYTPNGFVSGTLLNDT